MSFSISLDRLNVRPSLSVVLGYPPTGVWDGLGRDNHVVTAVWKVLAVCHSRLEIEKETPGTSTVHLATRCSVFCSPLFSPFLDMCPYRFL